ncbi:MAG: hypothetical protein KatS3mg108_1109 [Isosphaeraceae bacterium]|jgi:hypothetical protein|nr:MAG: hypothetical protein KatS3mg108_1109 [Isosphaeraceae bacterium]
MDLAVRSYRTEVVVPEDRVLLLHLPDDLPAGRALVMIQALDAETVEPECDDLADALDLDRADMEWWELETDDE